jgi:hypothetical protein
MGESVGRVACTLPIAAAIAARAPRVVNVAPARFTKLAGPRPGGGPRLRRIIPSAEQPMPARSSRY